MAALISCNPSQCLDSKPCTSPICLTPPQTPLRTHNSSITHLPFHLFNHWDHLPSPRCLSPPSLHPAQPQLSILTHHLLPGTSLPTHQHRFRRNSSSFPSFQFLGPKLMGEFSDFSSEIRIMKAKRSGPEIKNESKFVDIRTSLRCVLNLRVLPLRQQVTLVQN